MRATASLSRELLPSNPAPHSGHELVQDGAVHGVLDPWVLFGAVLQAISRNSTLTSSSRLHSSGSMGSNQSSGCSKLLAKVTIF